jgi:hypothetical protein
MDRRDADFSKIAELENTIKSLTNENARLRAQVDEYRKKEQSISNAIIASMEHANQLEASRKKLYLLDIQRSRLMYLRMEQIINELYRRYPEVRKDPKLKDMSDKFKPMVFNDLNEKSQDKVLLDTKKQTSTDDPIKKLLRNIIDCFDSKKVEEPIETKFEPKPEPKKEEPEVMYNISSSGFNLEEAHHPTMELEEIMKAFNLGGKKD